MAKKKKSRKQGMVSKIVNIGGIAIGLSRIIEIVMNNLGSPAQIPVHIINGATFGLAAGSFDMEQGVRFYTPLAGAYGYRKFMTFLLRRFPVR